MNASEFKPDLSVLQPPQRCLWDELTEVPDDFVLYGGTAIALRLGHRISIDFDFFGRNSFDPDLLYDSISFLEQSVVTQKAANTLTCLVGRSGSVQVSFFGVPRVKQLRPPDVVNQNRIKVASLLDLAGMKSAVVQKRAEAKDYLDIDAIISDGEIDLPQALAAAGLIYGSSFNPQNTLKALSYFEDGNLQTLPADVRSRLGNAVLAVDLDHLPNVKPDHPS